MAGAVYRLKPAGAGPEVDVKDGMVVGRNPECDLVLSNGHPSRKHARFDVKADGLWVHDLGSANGTFVNGVQIKAEQKLESGDRIAFDVNEFEVLGPPVAVQGAAPTVVRRPQEPPTVARPKAQTPEPGAPPPKPGSKVAAEAPKAPADRSMRKPGAWADPDYQGDGSGTKLFGADELKKLQAELKVPQVAAPSDAPYLVVASGASAGKSFKLAKSGGATQWEIGSDSSRDIVLQDAGVSAFHAKIVNEGNRWKLIDQMSANGTFVNGQKGNISYLKAGDRIRLGTIECTFQLPTGIAAVSSGGKRTGVIVGIAAFVVTAILIYVVMQML